MSQENEIERRRCGTCRWSVAAKASDGTINFAVRVCQGFGANFAGFDPNGNQRWLYPVVGASNGDRCPQHRYIHEAHFAEEHGSASPPPLIDKRLVNPDSDEKAN